MSRTFRLVGALSDRVSRSQKYSSVRVGDSLPPVFASFWEASLDDDSASAFSVVLGQNGTGKSRLFGAIADAFIRLRKGGGPGEALSELAFSSDGHLISLSDLHSISAHDVSVLPSKVIAVALTAFDKFPLEPPAPPGIERDEGDPRNFYRYVGMRDRTNRASITALLYRAIEGLARERTSYEVSRLREVFEFLGYDPSLKVMLNSEIPYDIRESIIGQTDLFGTEERVSAAAERLRGLIRRGRYSEHEVRAAIQYYFDRSEKGYLELEFDFSQDHARAAVDMQPIKMLRALGMIRLAAVQVRRRNHVVVDLRNASSGEISIFTAFLSIASHLEDGSLVLIDEPETGLHPEWQRQYLDLMMRVFGAFRGCHFILSTHSPLIIADLPAQSFAYSLDRRASVSATDNMGKSPDFVMANALDVVQPSNYYLRDILAQALALVSRGDVLSDEYRLLTAELHRLSSHLSGGDRVKQVIRELELARVQVASDAAD